MNLKYKKAIRLTSCILGPILLLYLLVCLLSGTAGVNGFSVTNGMIYLFVTGKDYLQVGENRYIVEQEGIRTLCIDLLAEKYDSYSFAENATFSLSPHDPKIEEEYRKRDISEMHGSRLRGLRFQKEGQMYRGNYEEVWKRSFYGYYAVSFEPIEAK